MRSVQLKPKKTSLNLNVKCFSVENAARLRSSSGTPSVMESGVSRELFKELNPLSILSAVLPFFTELYEKALICSYYNTTDVSNSSWYSYFSKIEWASNEMIGTEMLSWDWRGRFMPMIDFQRVDSINGLDLHVGTANVGAPLLHTVSDAFNGTS